MKLIGILGGTFDPIHNGHIHIAKEIMKQCPLTEIQFVPAFHPYHRHAVYASPEDRMAMLKLALKNESQFNINECEFNRGGLTYTYDTVVSFTKEYPDDALFLILGCDAFNQFDQWRNGLKILQKCNLLIVNRPGFELNNEDVIPLLNAFQNELPEIDQHQSGAIYCVDIPPLDVSSSAVRAEVKAGQTENIAVDPSVKAFILKSRLYK